VRNEKYTKRASSTYLASILDFSLNPAQLKDLDYPNPNFGEKLDSYFSSAGVILKLKEFDKKSCSLMPEKNEFFTIGIEQLKYYNHNFLSFTGARIIFYLSYFYN